jgi:hypothetical protein
LNEEHCVKNILLTLVLSTLTLPLAAHATGGALEINADCAAAGCFAGDAPGYPVEITQGGSYVLTSDLRMPGAVAISILSASTPIDIDLNDHAIDGGGSCTGTPATVCSGAHGVIGIDTSDDAGNAVPLHIHNGVVRGFSANGISLTVAGDGTLLDHLLVAENGGVGVFAESSDLQASLRIHDVQVTHNGSWGVYAFGVLDMQGSAIVGNGTQGVTLGGASGSALTGNRFVRNGGVAIDCGSATCALGQNAFTGNNAKTAGTAQYSAPSRADMGGNVCLDHAASACP